MQSVSEDVDGGARSDVLTSRQRATLMVLCGALFLDALDVSMINVALPSIREDLDLTHNALQWVVSGYVVGYGGFLLLGGRAADLFGRRRMFVGALAVFLIASGLGGLAPNGEILVASRFITGMAAAFTAPAGMSIITTTFDEGAPRNRALTVYAATGATGFSIGLVAGGVLTELGWRWVFWVPVIVTAFVLGAAVRLLQRDERFPRVVRLDIAGAVTLTGAAVSLIVAVVEAPESGISSTRTVAFVVASAVLLVAFVGIERRAEAPVVRLGLLRSPALVRANLGAMALFGSWLGFLFIATLYLQQLRGWSALATGVAVFPSGLLVAVLAPTVAAPMVTRLGAPRVVFAGLSFATVAYVLWRFIGADSSYVTGMLPTFVFAGLAFTFAFGPLNIAATDGVAPEEQGLAGGLVQSSFQFGGAVVLAVTSAVFDAAGESGPPIEAFRAATWVPIAAAFLGVLATVPGVINRRDGLRSSSSSTEADQRRFAQAESPMVDGIAMGTQPVSAATPIADQ